MNFTGTIQFEFVDPKCTVTFRKIAYFYFYTELENYKGACLSLYEDNMRLL